MAGIFTYKTINAVVPSTPASVAYTVPVGAQAFPKTITLVNTDALPRAVNVLIQPNGGTARHIWSVGMVLAATGTAGDRVQDVTQYPLAAGDAILWDAPVGSAVEGTIGVLEET